MTQHNPYEPPQADTAPPPAQQPGTGMTVEGYVPCPGCGGTFGKKAGFTWWGGVLGPKLLHHVVCPCGVRYNGKTGGSNTTAIVIYSIIVGVIAIAIFAAIGNS